MIWHHARAQGMSNQHPSPADWVDAANEVADFVSRMRQEEDAHAQGYSCGLEKAWDEDGRDERAS